MMRIVDLDQRGGLQIVRIDDAAIGFVVIAAQEGIDLADEGLDLHTIDRILGPRFTDGVEIPARLTVDALPEGVKLVPGQDAVERAAKQGIKGRVMVGGVKKVGSGQNGSGFG